MSSFRKLTLLYSILSNSNWNCHHHNHQYQFLKYLRGICNLSSPVSIIIVVAVSNNNNKNNNSNNNNKFMTIIIMLNKRIILLTPLTNQKTSYLKTHSQKISIPLMCFHHHNRFYKPINNNFSNKTFNTKINAKSTNQQQRIKRGNNLVNCHQSCLCRNFVNQSLTRMIIMKIKKCTNKATRNSYKTVTAIADRDKMWCRYYRW